MAKAISVETPQCDVRIYANGSIARKMRGQRRWHRLHDLGHVIGRRHQKVPDAKVINIKRKHTA